MILIITRELLIAVLEDASDQLSVLNAILPSGAKPSTTTDV